MECLKDYFSWGLHLVTIFDGHQQITSIAPPTPSSIIRAPQSPAASRCAISITWKIFPSDCFPTVMWFAGFLWFLYCENMWVLVSYLLFHVIHYFKDLSYIAFCFPSSRTRALTYLTSPYSAAIIYLCHPSSIFSCSTLHFSYKQPAYRSKNTPSQIKWL